MNCINDYEKKLIKVISEQIHIETLIKLKDIFAKGENTRKYKYFDKFKDGLFFKTIS